MAARLPVRILHVVGGMDYGGVETWLVNVLRRTDRERFQMDFLVDSPGRYPYTTDVQSLGGRLITSLHPYCPPLYALNFRRIARQFGPYAIVHGHVQHFTGFAMRLAQASRVPVRIAHSHNDFSWLEGRVGPLHRYYIRVMREWIRRFSTLRLAGSELSATSLFGPDWTSDPRCHIVQYGIDLAPFREGSPASVVRRELGIPDGALVIGNIGRMVEQKNQSFLIEIAAHLLHREPSAYLLLIGDGRLRPELERRVIRAGLGSRTVFTGYRRDLPRLVRAMDVFVLPSHYEGGSQVGVAAQAAGVPFVVADAVPVEADVVPQLVQRIPLSEPADLWAERIRTVATAERPVRPREALAAVEDSWWNVDHSVERLVGIYESAVAEVRAPSYREGCAATHSTIARKPSSNV